MVQSELNLIDIEHVEWQKYGDSWLRMSEFVEFVSLHCFTKLLETRKVLKMNETGRSNLDTVCIRLGMKL